MSNFKHIKKWTRPDNYAGSQFPEYYCGLGQHRDSDLTQRCNFSALLERLGGESETVMVARSGHWAVGWVEQILVHESDVKSLEILDQAFIDLEDYALLDEDSYFELEREEQEETFESYKDEFCKNVCKFIGIEKPRRNVKALEQLAWELYSEDCGYRGMEDAYISADGVRELVTRMHRNGDDYRLTTNRFYKQCLKKLGLKKSA